MQQEGYDARYPWDKWSWSAWRTDMGLRNCDAASRGIWMDLLWMADMSPRRGFIQLVPGHAPTAYDIAKITGNPIRQVERCIGELERNGVFSRDEAGVMYCRRMVRMSETHAAKSAAGRKGGNPALLPQVAGPLPEPVGKGAQQPSGTRAKTGAKPVDKYHRTLSGTPVKLSDYSNDSGILSNNSDLRGNLLNQELKLDSDSDKRKKESRNPSDSSPPCGGQKRDAQPPGSPVPEPVQETASGLRKPPRKEPTGPVMRKGVKRAPPAGPAELVVMEDAAVAAWNRMASVGFPAKCTGLDGNRRQKLRARLRELGGLDAWHDAINAIERSKLWQGQVAGRGGSQVWRPCFDDLLAPDKLRKLLEGGYDDTPPRANPEDFAVSAGGREGDSGGRYAPRRKPHPLDDLVTKYGLDYMRDEPDPAVGRGPEINGRVVPDTQRGSGPPE